MEGYDYRAVMRWLRGRWMKIDDREVALSLRAGEGQWKGERR
jgi:hypothetical protein